MGDGISARIQIHRDRRHQQSRDALILLSVRFADGRISTQKHTRTHNPDPAHMKGSELDLSFLLLQAAHFSDGLAFFSLILDH